MIRERWVRSVSGAMLYDARYADQFDARWFEPAHWHAQGAARATDGGRGASWFVEGLEPWVLRRYRRGGLVGRVLSDGYLWLGEARARPIAEWRLLAWAHDAGLPVVRPVGAHYQRGVLGYRGALLTERVPGRPLASWLSDPGAVARELAPWRAAGSAVARCHAAGLDHADLNLHNLLLADDHRCWVIDLDRGARRDPRGAWRGANLARLRRSLEKLGAGVPAAARAAAWRAFEDGYSSP